jgi:hypothetical protein
MGRLGNVGEGVRVAGFDRNPGIMVAHGASMLLGLGSAEALTLNGRGP